jgi:hypothetical protein
MMVAPRASLVGRRNYPGVPMARRQQAKPADPLWLLLLLLLLFVLFLGKLGKLR